MSDDEPSARARWLGVMLILVALAALIWQALEAGQAEEPPPHAAALQLPAATPSLQDMLASVDGAKLGMVQPAPAAANPVAASAPLAADEVELCGLGRVKVNAAGDTVNAETLKDAVEKAGRNALERVLPVLAGHGDEVVRAAGLLLQSSDDRARDALARMAVATQSPEVYRYALRACQKSREAGVCQMLSVEQLARIDPQSLSTWFEVAAVAQARGDAAAVTEALYRASRSTRAGSSRLASVVMSRLPFDMPVLEKGLLARQIASLDQVAETPYLVANQHCSQASVRDSNRMQTCLALAEVLSTQGSGLMDLSMGIEIGQRAGWPAERVKASLDERDAFFQLSKAANIQGAARQLSCDAVEKITRQVADIGREGQIVLLRRQLKQSPEGMAVLATRFREKTPPHAEAASAVAVGVR